MVSRTRSHEKRNFFLNMMEQYGNISPLRTSVWSVRDENWRIIIFCSKTSLEWQMLLVVFSTCQDNKRMSNDQRSMFKQHSWMKSLNTWTKSEHIKEIFTNVSKVHSWTEIQTGVFNIGNQVRFLKGYNLSLEFMCVTWITIFFRNPNSCGANSWAPWWIRWKLVKFNVALVSSAGRYGEFLKTGCTITLWCTITSRSSISWVPKSKTIDPKQ